MYVDPRSAIKREYDTHRSYERRLRGSLTNRESGVPGGDPVTLQEIVAQCQRDSVAWFPDTAFDLPFTVLALCGEVGELANLVKKVERGTHDHRDLHPKMVEEATDAFVYLCDVFAILGVDMEAAYHAKRAVNFGRFEPDPTDAGSSGSGVSGPVSGPSGEG